LGESLEHDVKIPKKIINRGIDEERRKEEQRREEEIREREKTQPSNEEYRRQTISKYIERKTYEINEKIKDKIL
jgi:hypothetical protein